MATPFSDVFEMFQQKVQDYKIDRIYVSSISNYEDYLSGFLMAAITNFKKCRVNLETDADFSTKTFATDLTYTEMNILATLMQIEWLDRECKDTRQISLSLSDTEFKRYAEGQNLKEKEASLKTAREYVDKKIVEYGWESVDFTKL